MVKKAATKQVTESVPKTPAKATKTVKKAKTTVVEEVVAPVVETVPETVESSVELTEEQSLIADYTNLSLKCQQASSILSSMKKELLALEKKTNRVLRTIKKTSGNSKITYIKKVFAIV